MIFTKEEQEAFTAYTKGIKEIPELISMLPHDFVMLMEYVETERWEEFTDEDFIYFLAFSKYIHDLAVDELARRGVFISEPTNTRH